LGCRNGDSIGHQERGLHRPGGSRVSLGTKPTASLMHNCTPNARQRHIRPLAWSLPTLLSSKFSCSRAGRHLPHQRGVPAGSQQF